MPPARDPEQRDPEQRDPGQRYPGRRDPGQRDPGRRDPGRRDPEEFDPGLVRERTRLAWTRTAIAFAAVGAAILKTRVVAGVIVIALGAVVWAMHRLSDDTAPGRPQARVAAITVTVVAAAVIALVVAFAPAGPVFPR